MDAHPPDFDTVYRTFHTRVLRYLTRLIGIDEAEDVAQEVFAKVGRALPNFRNESPLSTWVYRIATNTAMDRIRSAAHRSGVRTVPIDTAAEGEFAGAQIASPACSVEQQAIRDEMSGCVRQLFRDLPEHYQVALALSEMDELRNREIADILGVSLDAVKIRLHRARARLRKTLESHCNFYRNGENTLLCDIKPAQPAGRS